MGYVGWIGTFEGKKGTDKEKVVESEMVKMLRNAGAVLYCKTSVPHTLMSGETVNNIIGYTLNPKNRQLTSGGSSGGEGALIGIRGCAYKVLDNANMKKTDVSQHHWDSAATSAAPSASPLPSTASTVSVLPPAASLTKVWRTQWTAKTVSSPS
jgi:hypothetical protein